MKKHMDRYWGVALFALFQILPAVGNAAQPADDEEEPLLPAQPEAASPPKTEARPAPAPPVLGSEAPATSAPNMIEHMGPDTFPGRSRGIYGGSLWLEPTFHGLQWPRNTRTGLGVSGQLWLDSGYQMIKRDLPEAPDSAMYFQQGRGVLRVTPAYVNGNFFIQGQAELVGNLCQTASVANQVCSAGAFSTDDLWIRVGQWDRWDIKVGRFQGWEIAHVGMGLDPLTFERMGAHMVDAPWPRTANANPRFDVPALYGVSYLQDRPTDGLAVGYGAVHAYINESLRVEVLGKLGTNRQAIRVDTETVPTTYRGGRLTAIFDVGWFKFKAGGEYQKSTPTTQVIDQTGQKKDPVDELVQMGAGASAQFVIDPLIEFGLNAALGKQSYTDATGNGLGDPATFVKSYTTMSLGGFANLRLADDWLLGAGAHWTTQEDEYKATNSNANDYTAHLQGFVTLQYLLARQLYIRAVLAYANAKLQPSDIDSPIWNNAMYSGRIRLMYLY